MRCPQECRLCPEKVLTDDDKRPCVGGRRLGLVGGPSAQGREGGERFYLERSVLPWKTQDPKGRQPFLGQAGHRQARLLAEEARGAVALFMIKAWYSNSKTAQILWFLVFVLFCFNFKGENSRTSLAHLF